MKDIVLASGSFRRKEIMGWLGVPFVVDISDFPEEDVKFSDFDDPTDYASTIALGKVLTVEKRHPHALVIGSDTVVFLDGRAYGKPKDLQDACEMLQQLRGKTHEVYTAVVMHDGETGERRTEVVKSSVTFLRFSDAALEKYIATSEPYDKAGGYALQGAAKQFVEGVKGSAMNVVGFPVITVRDMLEDLGVQIDVDIEESVFRKTGYRT